LQAVLEMTLQGIIQP